MAMPAAVLSVLVTANTGSASANLTRLDRQLKGSAATAEATNARIAKAAKFGGLAIAAGLAGSVYAAAKFESAFAEVRKTVDASEKGFQRIETGLRNLSKRIPTSANELASLAGEAGALGVKSKSIVKFTKVAAQLGTTTNLSAEDASNALARLSNIMDTKGKKSFQRFGSTLVDLGNKGASTEDEIAEMALRIAGAGKTIGLTEADVLGLSAALANVGIKSEMGGTAISRVMLQMQDAIAKGGAELQQFAEISGTTTEQFTKQFSRDAPGAIAMFAEGLGRVNKAGESTMAVLDGVNLNEIRVRDTLMRITGNTKQFTDAQEIANEAWEKNNALGQEAKERYKTFESQLSMLKNTIVDTGIGIGEKLLPDLKSMVRILRDPNLTLDEKIQKVGERVGKMIEKWGPEAAEAGGKLGIAITKGIAGAFWNSNILGKLFIGAAALRLFGGSAAFTKLGTMIGKHTGKGVLIGLALAAPAVLQEWYDFVHKRRAAIINFGSDVGEWFVNGLVDAVNFGIDKINDAMDKANVLGKLGVDAPNIPEIGKVDFGHVREEVRKTEVPFQNLIDTLDKTGKKFKATRDDGVKSLDSLGDKTKKTGTVWDHYGGIVDKATGDASKSGDKHKKNVTTDLSRIVGSLDKAEGKTGDYADGATKNFSKVNDKSGAMAVNVANSYTNLANDASRGLKVLGENTNEALDSMGVKEAIKFSIKIAKQATRAVKKLQAGGIVGLQKGAIVPGQGSGDKVPLHIGGQLAAMVEPQEYVSVANRTATEALMGVNSKIKRRANGGTVAKLAGGGQLDFALGPYDIPPISYDANHAGGNSHVHITGTTTPWVVAIGKKLQQMGFMVGEHPAFGGVNAQHSATGGHYDALAIDVNSAADETRSEVASIARLIGGAGGVAGAVAEKVARVILNGPDGPLKEMGQAALDKVRDAANKYIASQTPKVSEGNFGPSANLKNLPAAFERYNKIYPVSSGFGDGYSMPFNHVAAIAEWAGAPGVSMAKTAIGESQLEPGAVGYDSNTVPGASSVGHGLWMITTGVGNDAMIDGLGGAKAMRNPLVNAIAMSKIFASSGYGAWFSKTKDTSNTHYTGGFGKKHGGIVPHLKNGGKPGKGKLSGKGEVDAIGSVSTYDTMPLIKAQRIREKIAALIGDTGTIAKLQDKIDVTEWMHGLSSSEMGEDLGKGEIRKQVGLLKERLAFETRVAELASLGMKWTRKGMKKNAPKGKKAQLGSLRGDFASDLLDFTGASGKTGRIWETKMSIFDLLGTKIDTATDTKPAMDISGLRSVIEAAQYGTFAGMFAKGGHIPAGKWGIAGERGPEPVAGPATVLPNSALSDMGKGRTFEATVPLHIELDGQIVRKTVRMELRQANDSEHRFARQHAQ